MLQEHRSHYLVEITLNALCKSISSSIAEMAGRRGVEVAAAVRVLRRKPSWGTLGQRDDFVAL